MDNWQRESSLKIHCWSRRKETYDRCFGQKITCKRFPVAARTFLTIANDRESDRFPAGEPGLSFRHWLNLSRLTVEQKYYFPLLENYRSVKRYVYGKNWRVLEIWKIVIHWLIQSAFGGQRREWRLAHWLQILEDSDSAETDQQEFGLTGGSEIL